MLSMNDNYNLQRFIDAHQTSFDNALQEIKNGKKTTHWMWYIFPQMKGLGRSYTSQYYAIESLDEAKAYFNDILLREHTLKLLNALMELETTDAIEVFGKTDSRKLQSSMTLFALAIPEEKLFMQVLDKFYAGKMDRRTKHML